MGLPWVLWDFAARREVSEREWVVWKKWSGLFEVVILGVEGSVVLGGRGA